MSMFYSVDKLSHSSIGLLGCLLSDTQQVHPWMLGRPSMRRTVASPITLTCLVINSVDC